MKDGHHEQARNTTCSTTFVKKIVYSIRKWKKVKPLVVKYFEVKLKMLF